MFIDLTEYYVETNNSDYYWITNNKDWDSYMLPLPNNNPNYKLTNNDEWISIYKSLRFNNIDKVIYIKNFPQHKIKMRNNAKII